MAAFNIVTNTSRRVVSRVPMLARQMSVRPEEVKPDTKSRKKVTIQRLRALREANTPISVLTAYDYPTGRACESTVDITLVGDSLAQTCLGYDSTTRLTVDEMLHHTKAVARGSRTPLLVVDMPFGSYHVSKEDAMRNASRFVQEAGAEAVKLEGGMEIIDTVHHLTSFGVPVMAHIGLMPQRHAAMSGYRVHGRTAADAALLLQTARALQNAGAFSLLLEAIPHTLAGRMTNELDALTIGIGAGPHTDGQVLVWDDAMGIWSGHKAKFVRQFADVKSETKRGVDEYVAAVKSRQFPSLQESYEMDAEQWEEFQSRTANASG